jgi:spore germination cell wall hydrolase CwlJ-like protein
MKSSILTAFFAVACFFSSSVTASIDREVECLTRNIYFEAGNESFAGKLAVAQVSLNRSQDARFPSSICSVVQQVTRRDGKIVCQFSWYCTNKRHAKISPYSDRYQESASVARLVLMDGLRMHNLGNALYFHAKHVNPKWGKKHVATIGNHIFYADYRK